MEDPLWKKQKKYQPFVFIQGLRLELFPCLLSGFYWSLSVKWSVTSSPWAIQSNNPMFGLLACFFSCRLENFFPPLQPRKRCKGAFKLSERDRAEPKS